MNTQMQQHGPISLNVAVQVVARHGDPKVVSKTWLVELPHLESSWTFAAFKMATAFRGLPLSQDGRMISITAAPFCFDHMDLAIPPVQKIMTTDDLIDISARMNLPVAEALAANIIADVQDALGELKQEANDEAFEEVLKVADEAADAGLEASIQVMALKAVLASMGVHADVKVITGNSNGNGHNHNGHGATLEDDVPDWIRGLMTNGPKANPDDDIPDWLRK